MNDPRHKLLDRFRSILLSRIHSVRRAVSELEVEPAAEELIRRELHTFKGEARMLSLMVHSELSHALEEYVPLLVDARGDRETQDRVLQTLDAMARSLDESTDPTAGETELVQVLQALARGPGSGRNDGASTTSSSEAPRPMSPLPAPRPHVRGRWTQVETSAIDRLCARMTELSSAYSELQARTGALLARPDLAAQRELFAPVVEDLERCRGALDECTVDAWSLRLVAAEPTLLELGRHAESIARSLEKPIVVRVLALGVQLESDVLDQLWDSLLHLVQNAVAHGLEGPGQRGDKPAAGTLVIGAESTGPSVILTVEDDGSGVDVDAVIALAVSRGLVPAATTSLSDAELLDVLCRRGFSTRSTVTELSGRGVGLDVVRSKVEALGGSVRIESHRGRGTRFQLNVPFAITKERMLVVPLGELLFGLPVRIVRAVIAQDPRASRSEGARVLAHGGDTLPLRSLADVLGVPGDEERAAAIVEIAGRTWALAIPRALGERDLIRTPADPLLSRTSPFGATALLDDGKLVLMPQLDRLALLLRAAPQGPPPRPPGQRRRRVLIVDDSPVIRDLVTEVLTTVGLDVTAAHDGSEGFRRVEEAEPDLVLSDVEMPSMDGFELLRRIRERSPRLPVVMLTTRASAEDRKRATSLGANAYLVKSEFQGGALVEVIQRFLDVRT